MVKDLEKVMTGAMRAFFIVAVGMLALAISEGIANTFGYTITLRGGYNAARLLEFSAVLLAFVVTLLLRQIRDQLKRGKG